MSVEPTQVRLDDMSRLERAYRAHHADLLRFAMLIVSGNRAEAEDLTQEAFVRLGRSGQWPALGAEATYLRETVVNLNRGLLRRLAVRRRKSDPLRVPALDDDVEGRAMARVHHARVVAEIRALPLRQAECVGLHYLIGLPDRDVAQTLGISEGTVKSHLARARRTLAQKLGDLR